MNLKQKILKIKDQVSIKDVVELYGLYCNRYSQNYHCPFHGEDKRPSASISKGVFHCFTCGKTWDAIDFVKEYEKCSTSTAVRLLDTKFRCGCYSMLSKEEYAQLKANERKKKKQEQIYKYWCNLENILREKILAKIRYWEMVKCLNEKEIYKMRGYCDTRCGWFFTALKEIGRLSWLYDVVTDHYMQECEYTYRYGTDRKKILRQLNWKKIKI